MIEDFLDEKTKKTKTKYLNQNELFGLREMLYDNGNSCQANYTYLTSKSAKIMAIHKKDFYEVFPQNELEKLIE